MSGTMACDGCCPSQDYCHSEDLMALLFDVTGITLRAAMTALAILLFVGHAAAQNKATVGSASKGSPFAQLAGSWSGAGTIDLANGKHEPIKCRASYDVLEDQNKLQLNLHCAGQSYNFRFAGKRRLLGRCNYGKLE